MQVVDAWSSRFRRGARAVACNGSVPKWDARVQVVERLGPASRRGVRAPPLQRLCAGLGALQLPGSTVTPGPGKL